MTSNKLKKLHQISFFLLIVFLPTQLGLHFWPDWSMIFGIKVDYLSPTIYLTDILVAATLAGWLLDELVNGRLDKWRAGLSNISPFIYLSGLKGQALLIPKGQALLIYLIITSLFIAQNQGVAIYKLIKLIEFFLFGFYIYKTRPLTSIHNPLAVAVLYSSIIAWMQFLLGRTLGGPLWWFGERTFDINSSAIALVTLGGVDYLRPYATFSHPNVLAGFTLIATIIILANKVPEKLKFVVGVVSFSTLVITFSQSAWFAGLIILGFTSFRIFSQKSFWIIFAAMVIFSLSLPFYPAGPSSAYPAGPSSAYNSTGLPPEILQRIELAKAAGEMFFDYPITGVGLGNFINKLPDYSNIPTVSWQLQPVHNIFWLVLAEAGILGFGFFLWFLGKLLSIYPFAYSPVYLSFLVIFLTGIFDHYWFTLQQGQLLSTIVFALSFVGKSK